MKLISVIVPAYNVKPYLERCINSVINQTYQELEVILVDDGSTDGTGILCDQISQKDSRITVIHKKNGGQADARNVGLDIALGDFVSFIDADDYIEDDMFEYMINEMNDETISFVAVGMVVSDPEGNVDVIASDERVYLTREEALMNIFENGKLFPSSSNKLFRRSLFNDIRYVTGIINEDTEIIFRVIHESNRILLLDKAYYHYMLRNGSTTRSDFGSKDYESLIAYESAVKICKSNYPQLLPHAQYYVLRELYETQVKLADSKTHAALWKYAVMLRMKIALAIIRCLQWSEIRCKYNREMLIYALSVLLGYRVTYQLMMLKQKIK